MFSEQYNTVLHMKPRQCTIMGYMPVGMCFNSVSMHHMSGMFHVCYEVTSVNTVELKSMMHDSDQQNMEKSVDCGSVVEWRVVEAAEWSGLEKKEKNKGKIAISSQAVGWRCELPGVCMAVFQGAILAPGVPLTSQQQFSEVLSSNWVLAVKPGCNLMP